MTSRNANKAVHENKQRPARVPFGAGNKLHIPEHIKKKDFFYYWAIDRKGMIEQMEAAYYEKVFVDGKPFTVPAGNGETHYAMCIEQRYHDEDMAAQQKLNIDTTAKQAQTLGENEYVPLGKAHVTEREII